MSDDNAGGPRLDQFGVRNYRSVGDEWAGLTFPADGPLVVLGENNAGKSNLTQALDFLFGEQWPGSRSLDPHDFHGRDDDGVVVQAQARVSGVQCPYCGGAVTFLGWMFDTSIDASNPYTFGCDTCNKTWPNKDIQTSLTAIRLGADRRLDYQLSYVSKYTMLSKLMRRFHARLLADPERRARLTAHFNALVTEFGGVPEFETFKTLLADTAADLGQSLPYRLDIDFAAYDPSNFFRSLRVRPQLDGQVRSFDELGTGQSQILAIAFAYAYGRAYAATEGLILVIDEPESNLHPLAQQWLASRLHQMSGSGVQVLITTHSPHFVNLARPENLVLVSKPADGATHTVQRTRTELVDSLVARGADPTRTTADTVGEFYSAGATTELVSGLFARRCVLVEGRTEAFALPELLKLAGLDVVREGIAVISVEGLGNIAKWFRLFTAFEVPVYCIFDTDAERTGAEKANLDQKRADIATAVGLPVAAVEMANAQTRGVSINEGYAMMHTNFETAMMAAFGTAWATLQDAGREVVGTSKPLLARFAAQRLTPELVGAGAEAVLLQLAQRIRGLPAEPPAPPPPAAGVGEDPPF